MSVYGNGKTVTSPLLSFRMHNCTVLNAFCDPVSLIYIDFLVFWVFKDENLEQFGVIF